MQVLANYTSSGRKALGSATPSHYSLVNLPIRIVNQNQLPLLPRHLSTISQPDPDLPPELLNVHLALVRPFQHQMPSQQMCVLERVVSGLGIVLGVKFEKSEAARASVEAFRNADGFELTVRAMTNKRNVRYG